MCYKARSFCDQCGNGEALVTEQDGRATYQCARPTCGLIIMVVDATKVVPTPTTNTVN